MLTVRRLSLPATLTASLVLAACTGAAPPSTGPSASPPPSVVPSASPTPAGIEHPTGADEVVLRYDEGGGFMMVEWVLAQVPVFTLYGDGTVVFRDPGSQPPPSEDGSLVGAPMRTATLSEEQVQALLEFAITEGGLASARDQYDNPMLADAGSAIFTISAGGRTKQVSVYGLSESDPSAPDQAARAQFFALAERLRTFDNGGSIDTAEYQPEAFRVHLIEAQGVPLKSHPWPWPDLGPADFKPDAGENPVSTMPHRVMSPAEVEALGLGELKGGLQGYALEGPDGKTYSLIVRPLLPDEAA